MAAGDHVLQFDAPAASADVSAPALTEWHNSHPVIEYPVSADSSALFFAKLTAPYAGGGITLTAHLAMPTAVAPSTVTFEAEWQKVTDLDATAFAPAKSSGAVVVPASTGELFTATFAFASTEIDGVVLDDLYRIRIRRDTTDASAAGPAWLRYLDGVET